MQLGLIGKRIRRNSFAIHSQIVSAFFAAVAVVVGMGLLLNLDLAIELTTPKTCY